MNSKLEEAYRILIVGDAGRGKTTMAQKLSKKLEIPHHSTDDFFWKTKFSEKQDKEVSLKEIKKEYEKESWIIEGTTQKLIEPGLEKADLIIVLNFKSLFSQWWQLIKRHKTRAYETVPDLMKLLRHVFYKRYGIGTERGKETIKEMLAPYKDKIVVLHSLKEIDEFIGQ